jgi:YVTN family beta-propeller protein
MQNNLRLIWLSIFVLCLFANVATAQKKKVEPREMDFDEAGSEETLNRELWESVKRTRYETALRHVARSRRTAQQTAQAVAELPNGWRIAPAGQQVPVGRLPMEAVPFAGQIVVLNTGYYSNEPQQISVVDPNLQRVIKVLRLPGLFPSALAATDGDLYVSGGVSQKVFRFDRNFKKVREYSINGYTAGIEPVDAARIAVVSLVTAQTPEAFAKGDFQPGRLTIFNTKTGTIENEVSVGYFPLRVRFANGKFFVTVLGENQVRVLDRELKPIGTLAAGRAPQTLCSDGDRLFTVNTGSDSLTVIDTNSAKVLSTISVAWQNGRFGSAPTSCTVDGGRLYVTQANTNDVAVYDAANTRLLGYVPTGFYPSKVFFDSDRMYLVNAKGVQTRRPNVDGPQTIPGEGGPQYVLTLLQGSLQTVPRSSIQSGIKGWTRDVTAGTPLFDPARGLKLPIKHVFYIVRENRTYDQVLGDLPRGNGDRFLTLFGKDITPNGHKIAEEFVTLDNFYADGEISVLGHSFTTSGYAGPFLQWLGNNAYSGRYPGYPFGMVPAVTSPAYLWDALDDRKINYRIYGENYYLYTRAYKILSETYGPEDAITKKFYDQMMRYASVVDRGTSFYLAAQPYYGRMDTIDAAAKLLEDDTFRIAFSKFLCGDETLVGPIKNDVNLRRRFAEYLTRYPSNYRSWNLNTSDLERAAAWKTDFDKQIARVDVAQLSYLWLPNDHTGGVDKRYLPPEQLVAQNDAALGFIINTIAKSPIWKESLILVVEDDAQNGPDHVDATRTVALAIGPYVRRNAVVSSRYDQLSLLRTIELTLGLSPLNVSDALAAPMFDIFTTRPDFRPYEPTEPSSHLNEVDRKAYETLSNGGTRPAD